MSDSNRTNSNDSTDTSTVLEYHEQVDWTDDDPVSSAVLGAVAAVSENEGLEFTPLYECVDPDALNALFVPYSDGTPRGDGCVSFTFNESDVTVHSHGEIVIRRSVNGVAEG